MNILTLTQSNRSFIMQLGEQKLIVLNQRSLVWQLKHRVGLDKTAIASVIHMFEYERVVEINLYHVVRAA